MSKIQEDLGTSKEMINNDQNQGIDIVFQNISYSVKVKDDSIKTKIPCKQAYKQKQILKGISGIFKAGKTTAIMGASGAGKTTLLNILSCRISTSEKDSKLYANNLQYTYDTFGDFANYVMQMDILMETLTVRETLQFAAKLKLNKSQEEQKEILTKLTNQLKLQKCLDTLVGGVLVKGVSGGQRKRTSIAFQLISDPQVLFLDEPTSGLDSLTSYIIVHYLHKLAKFQKKTVIMTIHQPNSQTYQLFDNLLILLQGKVIYQDQALKVTDYFQQKFSLECPQFINSSDYFMSKIHFQDQSNRVRYPQYFQAYENFHKNRIKQEIENKRVDQIKYRQIKVSYLTSLSALVKRNVLNTVRNPMLLKAKLGQALFLSLFIGGMYFAVGDKDYTVKEGFNILTGFLFFMSIMTMMSSLSPISIAFPIQRVVFFKEQDSKMYNTTSYFLARNIVELPELVIFPLISVSIYYFMAGLAATAQQFFVHFLVSFLMAFTGASLGLLVGSVILDAKSISTVVPLILLPIILFSGFFKNRQDLPVWLGWIQYISPIKYGFIGYLENQVKYRDSNIDDLNFDLDQWPAIFILLGLGVFFRLTSLFFLWLLRTKGQ